MQSKRRPPREVLKSIENKENLTDYSNKPSHTRQTSYRLNKQMTDINQTTFCKIRTPSRGRQLFLPPTQDNKLIIYPLTNKEEKRYQSTKESQQQEPQKPVRISTNIPRKRINLSAKDSSNDNLLKLIPPTCDDTNYQIGPIIGKGSYAIVKMGTDKHGNKVAIKMYEKNQLTGERLNNLIREISTIRMLNHDQIVKLHDVYHYASYVNLVLEYCGTESLYSLIKANRFMTKENAFNIIHQLLKILHHIHDRNICHRDIKLENVLIQNRKIVLIDFGFSTYSNQPITCHCGTPSYMAPEVVSKLKYDGRAADIWAVGVLFVALLQGSFPFKGENERELFKKIRNNESKIVNQDKDVWKVLSKIFVVDPFQRATAKELLQLDVFKN